MAKKEKIDVAELATNQIIKIMEKGIIPWKKSWNGGMNAPRNLTTKKEYTGINPFVLSSMGYESPYWLTFNQAKKLGGNVRKGEESTIVVFWKIFKVKDETKESGFNTIPLLKYYRVFNTEQVDGIDEKVPNYKEVVKNDFCPIEAGEKILANMPNKPKLTHNEARAYYSPFKDMVNMPKKELFDKPEDYYSVAFHEFTHSTGHASRLARPEIERVAAFGSATYSKEELVAEMGAAMLCCKIGIETATIENSAAYIQGWLKKLRNDKKFIFSAASQAKKAYNCILGNKEPDYSKK